MGVTVDSDDDGDDDNIGTYEVIENTKAFLCTHCNCLNPARSDQRYNVVYKGTSVGIFHGP